MDGDACSVSFAEQDIGFGRTKKDLDIVIIVKVLTKEFSERFWQFIKDCQCRINTKAWLDLREKKGIDSTDIKKHRNDILRIVSSMVLEECSLPE